MRPGAWSMVGFLGPEESLEAVLSRDAETLARHGVACEEIANALEELLHSAFEPPPTTIKTLAQRIFSLGKSPSWAPGLDTPEFRVYITVFLGIQECPWCEQANNGCIDFEIINRRINESIRGPGLIAHLIRQHHFFEGVESFYRVDPEKLMRVLELIPPEE